MRNRASCAWLLFLCAWPRCAGALEVISLDEDSVNAAKTVRPVEDVLGESWFPGPFGGRSIGSDCEPGKYASEGLCNNCEAGQYSHSGAVGCSKCSPGRFTPSQGSYECTECTAGKTACQECAEGQLSAVGAGACQLCSPGTYSDAKASTVCKLCALGKVLVDPGKTVCSNCETGHYSVATGLSKCTTCAVGRYQAGTGSTSCVDCPTGSYNNGLAATACKLCRVGLYSATTGGQGCLPCPAGTKSIGIGSTTCTFCTAGKYATSEGSAECNGCPVGRFMNRIGAVDCDECNSGKYVGGIYQEPVWTECAPEHRRGDQFITLGCSKCKDADGNEPKHLYNDDVKPEDCQKQCEDDPNCYAFSSGLQPNTMSQGASVSHCKLFYRRGRYACESNTDFTGEATCMNCPVDGIESSDACQQLCDQTPDCTVAVWNSARQCSLKSNFHTRTVQGASVGMIACVRVLDQPVCTDTGDWVAYPASGAPGNSSFNEGWSRMGANTFKEGLTTQCSTSAFWSVGLGSCKYAVCPEGMQRATSSTCQGPGCGFPSVANVQIWPAACPCVRPAGGVQVWNTILKPADNKVCNSGDKVSLGYADKTGTNWTAEACKVACASRIGCLYATFDHLSTTCHWQKTCPSKSTISSSTVHVWKLTRTEVTWQEIVGPEDGQYCDPKGRVSLGSRDASWVPWMPDSCRAFCAAHEDCVYAVYHGVKDSAPKQCYWQKTCNKMISRTGALYTWKITRSGPKAQSDWAPENDVEMPKKVVAANGTEDLTNGCAIRGCKPAGVVTAPAAVGAVKFANLGNGVCLNTDGERPPYCNKTGISATECKNRCTVLQSCTGYELYTLTATTLECYLHVREDDAPKDCNSNHNQGKDNNVASFKTAANTVCHMKSASAIATQLAVNVNVWLDRDGQTFNEIPSKFLPGVAVQLPYDKTGNTIFLVDRSVQVHVMLRCNRRGSADNDDFMVPSKTELEQQGFVKSAHTIQIADTHAAYDQCDKNYDGGRFPVWSKFFEAGTVDFSISVNSNWAVMVTPRCYADASSVCKFDDLKLPENLDNTLGWGCMEGHSVESGKSCVFEKSLHACQAATCTNGQWSTISPSCVRSNCQWNALQKCVGKSPCVDLRIKNGNNHYIMHEDTNANSAKVKFMDSLGNLDGRQWSCTCSTAGACQELTGIWACPPDFPPGSTVTITRGYQDNFSSTKTDDSINVCAGNALSKGIVDAVSCDACPANTFSGGGASVCSSCERGTISAFGSSSCVGCPIGQGLDRLAGGVNLVTAATDLRHNWRLMTVKTTRDYTLQFDIYPRSRPVGWRSIIHFTKGDNCCGPVDRIPGIWFHGATTRLYVRQSRPGSGNDGCDPHEWLPLNAWTTVKVELIGNDFTVSLNGVQKCRNSLYADRYGDQDDVTVYMGDPWHHVADAAVKQVFYKAPGAAKCAACPAGKFSNNTQPDCVHCSSGHYAKPSAACVNHEGWVSYPEVDEDGDGFADAVGTEDDTIGAEHELDLQNSPVKDSGRGCCGSDPQNAVNRDFNGHNGSYGMPWNHCHQLSNTHNPWWAVDLGATKHVTRVKLFNRNDCCPDRLHNVMIFLGNSWADYSQNAQVTRFAVNVPGNLSLEVAINKDGRYLFVARPGHHGLTLCEIQVWAKPVVKVKIDQGWSRLDQLVAGNRFPLYQPGLSSSCSHKQFWDTEPEADLKGLSVVATSGRETRLVAFGDLKVGGKPFIDRDYVFTSVGSYRSDCAYVEVADEDKNTGAANAQYTIHLPWNATVYLDFWGGSRHVAKGFNWKQSAKPGMGFQSPTHGPGLVYEKHFDKGVVTLFGNDGEGQGTYAVYVCPRTKGLGTLKCEYAKCPAGSMTTTAQTCQGVNCRFPSAHEPSHWPELCPCIKYTGATLCSQCAAGTFAPEGSSQCNNCSDGTTSTVTAGACNACDAGRTALAGDTVCFLCPVGKFAEKNTEGYPTKCEVCGVGRFAANVGAQFCDLCEPGKAVDITGATACTDCRIGRVSIGGQATCEGCPEGTFSATVGLTRCQDCSPGFFQDTPVGNELVGAEMDLRYNNYLKTLTTHREYVLQFDIYPRSRPWGWRSIIHFSKGDNCCGPVDRIPGIWFYWHGTTRLYVRQSRPGSGNDGCDPHEWLPLNAWTTVKVQLKGDDFTVSLNGVQKCKNSDYKDKNDDQSNVLVYMGDKWFHPADAAVKNVLYDRAEVSLSVKARTACTQCPPGHFTADSRSKFCAECPGGMFADQVAGQPRASCSICNRGKYAPGGGNVCFMCAKGWYNNRMHQSACQECPGGMYLGSTGQSQCTHCPAGQFSWQNGHAWYCGNCTSGRFSAKGSSFCTKSGANIGPDHTGREHIEPVSGGTE